jgi:hypothetical protein
VRDVGDEVAPDAIGASQVADVVQHDDRATGIGGHHRRTADDHGQLLLQRQFQAFRLLLTT